jgi:nitroreductase
LDQPTSSGAVAVAYVLAAIALSYGGNWVTGVRKAA